jgi:hypothetical protein
MITLVMNGNKINKLISESHYHYFAIIACQVSEVVSSFPNIMDQFSQVSEVVSSFPNIIDQFSQVSEVVSSFPNIMDQFSQVSEVVSSFPNIMDQFSQVSEVVSSFPNIVEANVYGVQVPGSKDGRACLAALTMRNGADLSSQEDRDKLLEHCKKELPS